MLNMKGTARIDFLYDKRSKKLYVNEINTIPYCFSHHLWEEKNISYKELLTIMMEDAIKSVVKEQEQTLTLENDIINNLKTSKIKEMK